MSARQMICYEDEGKRFQFRAAGIALREGHLLVHRASYEDFWTLPGGRVERFETGAETLAREAVEELGQPARIGRLVFVLESFFTLLGRSFHEIGFYYAMEVAAGFPFAPDGSICHRVRDGAADLEFKWVPADRDSLDRLVLLPAMLRPHLHALPQTPLHFVDRAGSLPARDIGVAP